MTVLFGHPTGNPNSLNAALAHFESGKLEAFCVPWMPTAGELGFLGSVPGMRESVKRLERRTFPALAASPRIEGRLGEWSRMARRLAFGGRLASEALSYEANDWLMRTMRENSRRKAVTAVHSYEDCSLWSFEEAKRLGKACIYDLPSCYFPAWKRKETELAARFADWLPSRCLPPIRFERPDQKKREMELADIVLVPSSFVRETVHRYLDNRVEIANYGVDSKFWHPSGDQRTNGPMRFLFAGQCSVRKGTPMLLEAWKRAALQDATLDLVGQWQLAGSRRIALPGSVKVYGPVSPEKLRIWYQASDIFVFPSNFEGFGLVILEAMACGLPVIATETTAGPDVLDDNTGRVIPADDLDALVAALRWASAERDLVARMRVAARRVAEANSWDRYRACVQKATAPFIESRPT